MLGCMDRQTAYAIPFEEMENILERLHETQGRHWHIALAEQAGGLELITKTGSRLGLNNFELPL